MSNHHRMTAMTPTDYARCRERPIIFSAPMVRAILAGTKTQTRRAWREQPPPGVRVVADVGGVTACPYGGPGDRLWVRETHMDLGACYLYRADAERERALVAPGQPWRPAIHMPRAASRITLEITGVRVQRLQDISAHDCIAEGIEPTHTGDAAEESAHARAGYATLWESINGARSWDVNPWVWVVEFKRADQEPAT